jgi:hypothetical protein
VGWRVRFCGSVTGGSTQLEGSLVECERKERVARRYENVLLSDGTGAWNTRQAYVRQDLAGGQFEGDEVIEIAGE